MNVEQVRLKNGLETLYIHNPGAPSACVQIWFRAGSALESKSERGIAHFLEHMFFKGTPTRPGAQIAHEVESFGGEVNAFTSFDYTCYYINTPANYLNKTIEILLDMVSNPMFLEEDIIPERDVVFEEYRRALDNPSQYNFKNIQETSFTKGYAHQILGTEKTIKGFTQEQLIDFRNRYYNLNNAMLVVAGDIKNRKKADEIIENFKIPEGKTSSFPNFQLKENSTSNVHNKHVNQTTLTLAIQAPSYIDDDAAAEDLAVNCLAYGEISPLYKKLVTENSIVSNVSGSTMFFNKGGIHFIKLAFPTENLKSALKLFQDSLKDIIKRGFNENEVQRIKSQYIASKIYEKESIESFAFSLGHGFAQTGNIYCEDEFIKSIKHTSIQHINKALVSLFSRAIHMTVQLPQDHKKESVKKELESLQQSINNIAKSAKVTKEKSKITSSKYDEEVKVVEVKKGVKLVYRQNKMTPTFVFHAYLKGGLSYEKKDNNGIHYFLSKLLTYGYGKTNFETLKNDLEKKSAYLNGFSGKNAYGLTLHGLSENFKELLDHFFGTLKNPKFPNSYLKVEKELVRRILLNYEEDPVKQCIQKLNETVFNLHPYSMNTIGSEQSIKNISKKLISETHQERLKNSELVFTYCGDLEFDYIYEYIKLMIKDIKSRTPKKKKENKLKPLYGQHINIDFDREQTHIFIGRPAYAVKNSDDLYLKMITTYLSGQSSELFVEVRDRQGLCYAVQPLHHTALEAGYWGIYIGAGKDKVDNAIEAILDIINNLQKNGLSKKEFERIKVMLDGQNQLNIQTNDDYANFYSIPILHDLGIDYQHKSFDKIRNFNHEDFNKFLKKFFKTKWNIIKVGPLD